MRIAVTALIWILSACVARSALGQYEAPAESCQIAASQAFTWTQNGTNVLLLQGPVTADLDKTAMSGRQAVVWITPVPGAAANVQRVEIALIGEANLTQPDGVARSGRELFVDARLRGPLRLSANRRSAIDQSDSDVYKAAARIRPTLIKGGEPSGKWTIVEPSPFPTTAPATQPVGRYKPIQPVSISAQHVQTAKASDGRVVAILAGKVTLFQRTEAGDFLELLADRAVVFTPFTDLSRIPAGEQFKNVEQAITGAYLEGDVRVFRTPAKQEEPDQRLNANRAYYDFTTDRAILTDVILYTRDPKTAVPIVIRADTFRQLSMNEYTAEKSRITTSAFHTPTFDIGARTTYIRQTDIGDPVTGTRTNFVAKDVTFDVGGTPVFYSPYAAGSITEHGVFREIQFTNRNAFGFGVMTQWGLFESLGRIPPKGTDASYRLDYFSKRGPAVGLDAKYQGGSVSETSLEPWSYSGDFTSYLILDHGDDDLGRNRAEVDPNQEVRGRFFWQHQHFLPDDWQVQVSVGYISDPTFMEEWFRNSFRNSRPLETAFYAKHQKDTEAFTFLATAQPNDFVSVADLYQEQFEIERYPELGYHRIGDSILDDKLTFYSDNLLSAMHFKNSGSSLADLGFLPANSVIEGRQVGRIGQISPGIPSVGQTGSPEDTNYRGDFRQEVDWPFSLWRFRMMPYVMGRYTEYSESVDGGQDERVYAGAGFRTTTAFWRVDDSVESKLFDIHRLRHVVEPEVNVYTSVQSKDRDNFLIYDEPIDAITDISAVQVALNQRWQTKRGGPGNWRSVDVFTFNLQYNQFFNEPPEAEMNPSNFRGLYFVSMPEASVPRSGVNAQMDWKVSDVVDIPGELYFNTEEGTLAAASIGMSVRQDPRLTYYIGLRHIGIDLTETVINNGELNTLRFEDQDLIIFAIDYELTTKYRVNFANSYDLAQSRNDRTSVTFIRKFDTFFVAVGFRVDETQDETSVFFNMWPTGAQPGSGTQATKGFMQ